MPGMVLLLLSLNPGPLPSVTWPLALRRVVVCRVSFVAAPARADTARLGVVVGCLREHKLKKLPVPILFSSPEALAERWLPQALFMAT